MVTRMRQIGCEVAACSALLLWARAGVGLLSKDQADLTHAAVYLEVDGVLRTG